MFKLYYICLEYFGKICVYYGKSLFVLCPRTILVDLIQYIPLKDLDELEAYFIENDICLNNLWKIHYISIWGYNFGVVEQVMSYKNAYFQNLFLNTIALTQNFSVLLGPNKHEHVLNLTVNLIEKHKLYRHRHQYLSNSHNIPSNLLNENNKLKWKFSWSNYVKRISLSKELYSELIKNDELNAGIINNIDTLVLAGFPNSNSLKEIEFVKNILLKSNINSLILKYPQILILNVILFILTNDLTTVATMKLNQILYKASNISKYIREPKSTIRSSIKSFDFVQVLSKTNVHPSSLTLKTNTYNLKSLSVFFIKNKVSINNLARALMTMHGLKELTLQNISPYSSLLEEVLIDLIVTERLESLALVGVQLNCGAMGFIDSIFSTLSDRFKVTANVENGDCSTAVSRFAKIKINELKLANIGAVNTFNSNSLGYSKYYHFTKIELRSFSWTKVDFNYVDYNTLITYFGQFIGLKSLELVDNNILRTNAPVYQNFNYISQILRNSFDLEILKLRNVPFDSRLVSELIRLLANDQLRVLHIEESCLRLSLLENEDFVHVLMNLNNLKILSLPKNYITNETVMLLSNRMRSISDGTKIMSLEQIDLSNNLLSFETLEHLCETINHLVCLNKTNLKSLILKGYEDRYQSIYSLKEMFDRNFIINF